MRGIVYCRVSSQEQVQGTSLESQKAACLEYATKRGIRVSKVFIEKGESATAADRTELVKALDYCKENKPQIEAFIVWKLDRFARNLTDHYGLQAQLLKFGTTLHSVTEEIIGEGPIGKMMEAVLAGYAQFENDIRKQRCEGGMRARIRDGIFPWKPPLGYVHSKNRTDRRKLMPDQPDPDRFALIQRGLRLYAEGNHTITALAVESNKWGLTTRSNGPMSKQQWDKILVDHFYAGSIRDPWSGEVHRGQHKPMITQEEFLRIQAMKKGLSNNATSQRLADHPDFPLRGIVKCSCGTFMTASWQTGRGGKKYPRYRCHNKSCDVRASISREELEKSFLRLIEKVTPDKKFLRLFEAIIIDEWRNRKTAAIFDRSHHEKEALRVAEKKQRLIEMRANGEITKEEFDRMREGLENQMLTLQISQNEATTGETSLDVQIRYAVQFIPYIARQWQDMTDSAQRKKLARLVLPEGFTYDKTTGTIGTAVLSPIFKLYEECDSSMSHLVAGAGIAPATSRL